MCTKPLKGWKYGKTATGKDNYIITSYEVDHVEITKNGNIYRAPTSFVSADCRQVIRGFQEIPCGKCLECRLNAAKVWADRCMLEASQHNENCFITLTYDDQNIPIVDGVNPITGEVTKYKTLKKKDLQDFLKRLRRALPDKKIRFFASGEYGSVSLRPHYHLIIFGWNPINEDPDKCRLVKASNLGYAMFSSELISEKWPYGNNIVAECSWDTCNYVARYIVKKQVSPVEKCDDTTNIEKEFITMSRKPGIGLNWYLSHSVCYATFLNQYLPTQNGSKKISPNRYFDSKLQLEDEDAYEEIKERRKHFQREYKRITKDSSDLSYTERLKVVERNLKERTMILRRQEL